MPYKSKLIDAAKFYEDYSSSFARKVSVPFITLVSRRRMRLTSPVKPPCAAKRAKFHKYCLLNLLHDLNPNPVSMLAVLNLIYIALSFSVSKEEAKKGAVKFNLSSFIAYPLFKTKLKFNVFI
jgi:hypothetical protein